MILKIQAAYTKVSLRMRKMSSLSEEEVLKVPSKHQSGTVGGEDKTEAGGNITEWTKCRGTSQMLMVSCNKELFPDLSAWIAATQTNANNHGDTIGNTESETDVDDDDGKSYGKSKGAAAPDADASTTLLDRKDDIDPSEVMVGGGSTTPPHQTLTTGFFNVIFTRAEVRNVHKRLKLVSSSSDHHQHVAGGQDQQQARYLSEINVDIFPFDVFISTECIEMVTQALLPFLNLLSKAFSGSNTRSDDAAAISNEMAGVSATVDTNERLARLNNNTLPLLYLKAKSCRLFIYNNSCKDNQGSTAKSLSDVFIVELECANLTSQVDNPISRVLVDQRLYYKSAEAGTLEVSLNSYLPQKNLQF